MSSTKNMGKIASKYLSLSFGLRGRLAVGLLYVVVYLLLLNSGCSRPETVAEVYDPADCPCIEPGEEHAGEAAKEAEKESEGDQIQELVALGDKAKNPDEAQPAGFIQGQLPDCVERAQAPETDDELIDDASVKSGEGPEPKNVRGQKKSADAGPAQPIDLNTATLSELMSLPGVGPSTAERIIDYRQKRRFEKLAHLMRVKGIGQAKFNRIKPHISVSSEVAAAP